jgi:hypothetical protein
MKSIQNHSWMKVLVLAAFVACLSAGLASAQEFKGSFTLPFDAQWGGTTLPAGDYSFRINTARAPYVAHVRGEQGSIMVLAQSISDRPSPGHSELVIANSRGKSAVRALCLAELGVVLSYGKSQPQGSALARHEEPILYRRVSVTGK